MVKKINGWGMVLFVIILFFFVGYISTLSTFSDDIIYLISYCIITLYLIYIFWKNKIKLSFFLSKDQRRFVGKFFWFDIIAFVSIVTFLSVTNLVLIKVGIVDYEPVIKTFVSRVYFTQTINFVTWVFLIIIPIIEELVFRGIITNKLTQYFNIKLSILISGVLFTVGHGSILIFFLSLFFNFVYIKSQSIVYPILFHFFNNALFYVKSYLIQRYFDVSSVMKTVGNFNKNTMTMLYVALSLSFVIIIMYIFKYYIKAKFTFDDRGRVVYKLQSEKM